MDSGKSSSASDSESLEAYLRDGQTMISYRSYQHFRDVRQRIQEKKGKGRYFFKRRPELTDAVIEDSGGFLTLWLWIGQFCDTFSNEFFPILQSTDNDSDCDENRTPEKSKQTLAVQCDDQYKVSPIFHSYSRRSQGKRTSC